MNNSVTSYHTRHLNCFGIYDNILSCTNIELSMLAYSVASQFTVQYYLSIIQAVIQIAYNKRTIIRTVKCN